MAPFGSVWDAAGFHVTLLLTLWSQYASQLLTYAVCITGHSAWRGRSGSRWDPTNTGRRTIESRVQPWVSYLQRSQTVRSDSDKHCALTIEFKVLLSFSNDHSSAGKYKVLRRTAQTSGLFFIFYSVSPQWNSHIFAFRDLKSKQLIAPYLW